VDRPVGTVRGARHASDSKFLPHRAWVKTLDMNFSELWNFRVTFIVRLEGVIYRSLHELTLVVGVKKGYQVGRT
jgi:hypothetical protein